MTDPSLKALREAAETLKPCPFCGGSARIVDSEVGHSTLSFVTCNECFCCVGEAYDRSAFPEHLFHSHEDAAAAWNRRAPDPPLAAAQAQAARAREEAQTLAKAVRSFERADTEMRRATWAGEQPRMQDAGNRFEVSKFRLFKALRSLTRAESKGEAAS